MPERIGRLLPSILEGAHKRQTALLRIQKRWKRLVGKALAGHTKPVSLRRGRLIVHVGDPGDSFLLSYERRRILKRLKASGTDIVEELVFRAGDV